MEITGQLNALSAAAVALIARGASITAAHAGFNCYLQLHTPAGLEGLGIEAVEDQSMRNTNKIWFKASFMGVELTWAEPRQVAEQPPEKRVL